MPPKKPDEPIDTGTGGFNIDGELNTYDVGAPDDRPSYGAHSKGQIEVDIEGKDLSRKTKTTLAQFLGKKTVLNSYAVDQKDYTEINLSDTNGLVPPVAPSSNAEQFKADLPSSRSSAATTLGNYNRGRTSLNAIKGLSIPNGPVDGNRLLQGAVVEENGQAKLNKESPVAVYTSAVLSQNRFNNEKRMPGSSLRRYQKQPQNFGHYSGGDNPTPGTQDFNESRMAQVGPTLTLRAGLELGSPNSGYNPSSTSAELKALLPGTAQIGINTVARRILEAGDVLDDLYTNQGDKSTTTIEAGPSGRSWGNLNNVLDPYSGITSFGMQALSFALVLGVNALFSLLGVVMGFVTPEQKAPSRDAAGRYTLGSYVVGKKAPSGLLASLVGDFSSSKLGIRPTRNEFNKCLKTGIDAFFASKDVPGYNVIVCRAIIRSGVTIVESIKKIGGNPISIAKGILGLVDVLASSKLISAMNVFAQLGDAILSTPASWRDANADSYKVSQMDSSPDVGVVNKSRLTDSLKLAWSSNRASATLLIPSSVLPILANKQGDSPTFGVGGSGDELSNVIQRIENGSRLPAVEAEKRGVGDPPYRSVEEIESALDAEYMPFSFHDIRTNEVVSFHAFLDSLTDNFNASYDQHDGIGRVEPVKIYKNTTRKIGMSFHIISTSPSDFDDMWLKINKLTTLMYPQYTRGRLISDGKDYTVRQPFSQVVGASPLVRIRLGDLIRTNYSKFALSRLFGMGDPSTKVNGAELKVNKNSNPNGTINKIQEEINGVKTGKNTNVDSQGKIKFTAEPAGFPLSRDKDYNFDNGKPKWDEVYKPTNPDLLQIRVLGSAKGKIGVVLGKVEFNQDAFANVAEYKQNESSYKKKLQGLVVAGDGGVYEFPVDALTPTQETLQNIIHDKVPPSADAYYQKFSEFMGDDNAIVKSFKTTAGKGLAGFIESMDFDWYSKTSWETMNGRAAPQMCKVTISFNPVHDISPGLDADGFNRAPIYPVGPFRLRK